MSKVYINVEAQLGASIPEILEEMRDFAKRMGVNVKCPMNEVVYFVSPTGRVIEIPEFRKTPGSRQTWS